MMTTKANMLNKFVLVELPSPRKVFNTLRLQSLQGLQYSPDEAVPTESRKLDVLADLANYDAYMQEKENSENSNE